MSGANQALTDIVFTRDMDVFQKKYGDHLKIAYRGYLFECTAVPVF
jgi:hypothetical protein